VKLSKKQVRRVRGVRLTDGEEVVTTAAATATGAGSTIGLGALIGLLAGLTYAISTSTALPLPSLVLGTFAGIIIGYVVAGVRARLSPGPGAIGVVLLVTNRRVLILAKSAGFRRRLLREYTLAELDTIEESHLPVGNFTRLRLIQNERLLADLIVRGRHRLAGVHSEHNQSHGVD
jgi:hypothetical protein